MSTGPAPRRLTERTTKAKVAASGTGARRYRARIIEGDRQGSSGYYPADMLAEFGPRVFVEGLQVYADHPTLTADIERPERSIRDLIGRLASTAVYEGDGLYADVEVFQHWAPVIEAMAGDIGMSIRAAGFAEPSDDRAIPGPIITALTAAESVDFVTRAGAGGKLTALLESARAHTAGADTTPEMSNTDQQVGQSTASAVAETTTTKEATVAEPTSTETGAPPQSGGAPNTLPAAPANVSEATTRVSELERQLAEARENQRLAADDTVQLHETRRLLAERDVTIAQLRGAEQARVKVAEAFKANGTLPATALARVTAEVVGLDGSKLPLAEGRLDLDALKAHIDAAILTEARYVAEIAESQGYSGAPRGNGAHVTPGGPGQGPTETEFTESMTARFARLPGMTPEAAALAAKGR